MIPAPKLTIAVAESEPDIPAAVKELPPPEPNPNSTAEAEVMNPEAEI